MTESSGLRLGLLRCDDPVPELAQQHGTYAQMFAETLSQVEPNLELSVFSLPDGEWPTEAQLTEFDGWLTTGTRASVYDDVTWIEQFAELVRTMHQRKIRFFGICFGHQMIAHALGGKVTRADHGWTVGAHQWQISSPRGWMDPPAEAIRLLHSHQDQVIEPPPGATVLAGTPSCPVTMMELGDHFVGMQGHLEFGPEFVRPLYQSRVELMGAEVVEAACNSLADPLQRDTAARWIINFFRRP